MSQTTKTQNDAEHKTRRALMHGIDHDGFLLQKRCPNGEEQIEYDGHQHGIVTYVETDHDGEQLTVEIREQNVMLGGDGWIVETLYGESTDPHKDSYCVARGVSYEQAMEYAEKVMRGYNQD